MPWIKELQMQKAYESTLSTLLPWQVASECFFWSSFKNPTWWDLRFLPWQTALAPELSTKKKQFSLILLLVPIFTAPGVKYFHSTHASILPVATQDHCPFHLYKTS